MSATRLSLCACAIALVSLVPAEAGSYDGQWAVELSTQQGQCGLNYHATISVAGGRINESGMFVQASGIVEPTGKVAIRITRGSDLLAAGGVLRGHAGSGDWNMASQQCSGMWRAARV